MNQSVNDIVRRIMWRGGWLTVFHLKAAFNMETGKHLSDSGLTARIRDQRKSKHGGWTVACRLGKGKSYEYKLIH